MSTLRLAFIAFFAWVGMALAQAPPPVPALPDTPRITSYSLSASNCACAVNFALYGDSTDYWDWVEVWINGVNAPYNGANAWTVTSPTGPLATIPRPVTDAVLTFASPITGTVQIVGARRPRRVSQFTESRGVAARDLNQAITDIIAMLRETWDKINDSTGRTLMFPPGNTAALLPEPPACANDFLAFDSTGVNPVCQSPSTFLVNGTYQAVTSNAALTALTPSAGQTIWRLGFSLAGDSHLVLYKGSTSACSATAGGAAGDGGYQVPGAVGCWTAQFAGQDWMDDYGVFASNSAAVNTPRINAWLAGWTVAGTPKLLCNTGIYQFNATISFPTAGDDLSIECSGHVSTRFNYVGASNNIDLMTGCSTSANCTGWNLTGFDVYSSTTMVSGACIHFSRLSHTNIVDVSADVADYGTRNCYNAWNFTGAHVIVMDRATGYGINDCLDIAAFNSDGTNDSDFLITNSVLDFCGPGGFATQGSGLHVGGGFGGVFTINVELLGNSFANILIDQGLFAGQNLQTLIGSNTVTDGIQLYTRYGVYINETTGSGELVQLDGFFGSSIQNGIYIKSLPNGVVTTGASVIFNDCQSGILDADGTTMLNIGSSTQIWTNGGYLSNQCAAYNTVTAGNAAGTLQFTQTGFTGTPLQTNEIMQISGSVLPGGISGGTNYYVQSVVGSTFTVSATPGGSPVAWASAGSGVQFQAGYGVELASGVAFSNNGYIISTASSTQNVSGDGSPTSQVGSQTYAASTVCGATGAAATAYAMATKTGLRQAIISVFLNVTVAGSGANVGCTPGSGAGFVVSLPFTAAVQTVFQGSNPSSVGALTGIVAANSNLLFITGPTNNYPTTGAASITLSGPIQIKGPN